ncbi:MAG: PolC-type DNA polymerase III [bacterium]|nr:PolC-type DNA polymerase III [bacterium]
MAKSFFEVFPSLKLNQTVRARFEPVSVERVSTTRNKDALRVYLFSERLLQKEDIFYAEQEIKKQLFPRTDMTVRLLERYVLSAQYDLRKLMDAYYDSLLLELRAYDHILFSMMKKARFSYPGEHELLVEVEDTVLARGKERELKNILDNLLQKRFSMHAEAEIDYREAAGNKHRQEDEERLRREVIDIVNRAGAAAGMSADGSATDRGTGGTSDGVDGFNASHGANGAPQEAAGFASSHGANGALQGASGFNASHGANGAPHGADGFNASHGANGAPHGADSLASSHGANGALQGTSGFDTSHGVNAAPQGKSLKTRNAERGAGREFGKGAYAKGGYGKTGRRSDNPDVIWGRDFDDEPMRLDEIQGEMEEVVVSGMLTRVDPRAIKNEKTILIFDLTDFTDTITVKMFFKNEQFEEVKDKFQEHEFVKLKGVTQLDRFDGELTIGSIFGIKKSTDTRKPRMDYSVRKRVELHCHTKMSDMDGVSDVSDLLKCANRWGMTAMAITDHGDVQAFPDANHALDKLAPGFKPLYGVEGYLVDDLKQIVTNPKPYPLDGAYVVFDLETTGFSPVSNRIIEIGAVRVEGGKIKERFSTFVNPDVPIPYEIEKLTNIRDSMVIDAPMIEQVLPEFAAFCEGAVLVAHNADFDMSFFKENCRRQGFNTEYTYLDTVGLARALMPELNKFTLDTICKKLNILLEGHHRAVNDAEATAEIFLRFLAMCKERGVDDLAKINALGAANIEAVRKLHAYHVIVLAKNDTGRINLYKLISESHLNYFSRRPKMPKSLLMKYREGLIIGSACEAGELFRAIVEQKSEEEISRIVRFYDYLEVQPIGNNRYMIRDEKHPNVRNDEDLIALNKKIIALGEQFCKPVVATCDVHFLNPEDEIYRRILMAGQGFPDADEQAPLYFRTTEEMLSEFSYLSPEKAEEIVITNPNLIADMCEYISPVRPDKCPPVIENSDQILTEICYNRAHELYGETLPDVVEKRLKKELNSIISNGFAVMYIIAQKLVWKSVEDGYLVGSRGSVGSSFVAFMAGITEVNSLAPHYRCANCYYTDFDSEEVAAFSGRSGCDMPDKICPKCGKPLIKDGFDIPFETFLGFKGNKEPDIDLNFSGEYQSKAHKYTEVIFGYGQTYRAGTIGAVADKTAYGYVRKYFEERGVKKRASEINRLSVGCTGVRRTTGQHPGGIVVLPVGEEINSFTPVQHPANDMTTPIITTHFDYHSIDHNLLKLDILGHDDPTMIRMLQDLTGVDPTKIPLDDQQVMSLFSSTEALGITPEEISGCELGSLGIPEFGTEFVIQMLKDTKPQSFSDLVRISGLSHGTDVWLGNAQTLIEEGKATISTAICTRDDIMIYLIQKGIESEQAFSIMEKVRKGKGLTEEMEQVMLEHDVPDWYIWSCKKIKYMFPKAHAAAYVMMAWRIAYCKVNYPLAYYAAYFSIRAKAFSYALMCRGRAHLESIMSDYKKRMDTLANKEQDAYGDMKIVQEMYARGYEFVPIDIFKAQSRLFTVTEDGKIMPSLTSIDGVSEAIADAIVEAAKDGPFLSRDDFYDRTKTPKKCVDEMAEMGLLGDIPLSNQLSLFDFVS